MQQDFIAILKYKTTQEGGRSTPAFSGYRPTIKFEFDEMVTGSMQTFLNVEEVYPGEAVEAEIVIIATSYFKGRLREGMDFIFTEGPRVVGTGVIKEIINKDLIIVKNADDAD